MNMICNVVRELAEPYHEGSLSNAGETLVRSHLGTCSSCRAYYAQYAALEKRGPEALPEEYVSDVQKRTYAELSNRMRRRRLWEVVGAGAAIGAGSMMLAIGLLLTYKERHMIPREVQGNASRLLR